MDTLWAPWRMTYIKSDKDKGCIFCEKPKDRSDEASLILFRAPHSFVMMNAFPYINGHLLVAPYQHAASLEGLGDEIQLDLMKTTQRALGALRAAFKPEGFNVGANLGKVAGAGFEAHLHLHVVPRWGGDTNFMAVIPQVRVIPQSLEDTYRELLPHFRR